jgi:hypothetical protein
MWGRRGNLAIIGQTGSHKTSVTMLLSSLYGPSFRYDAALAKWGYGATTNALLELAAAASDLPFVVDNFKPSTGGGDAALISFLHAVTEGRSKDRLNRASEIRDSRPIHCWAVITGESFPRNDPSTVARTLIVEFPRRNTGEDAEDAKAAGVPDELIRAQDNAEHLCAVGASWIAWLESDEGQRAIDEVGQAWNETHKHWAQYLHKECHGAENPDRIAVNLSVNEMVWKVMERHPQIGEIAKRYADKHHEGLKKVAATVATGTSEGLEARRYINIVRDLLASGKCVLQDRALAGDGKELIGNLIGWKDDKGVYLIPDVTLKAVLDVDKSATNQIDRSRLYRQMAELGWLNPDEKNKKPTRVIKIGGLGTKRVLHINYAAMDEPESDEISEADDSLPF